MVLRKIRSYGKPLTALVAGVGLLFGGCKDFCVKPEVPVVSQRDEEIYKYADERSRIVERLVKALGDRLEDRIAIFNSELENKALEAFARIYEGDKTIINEIFLSKEEKDAYERWNPSETKIKEKFREYEEQVPWNFIPDDYNYSNKDADKLALVYHYMKSSDFGVSLINY